MAMSIEAKLRALENREIEITPEVRRMERRARLEREKLLNLPPNSKIYKLRFAFDLGTILSEQDESLMNLVLASLALNRYKDDNWQVYGPDSEEKSLLGWVYSELRWPRHYCSYVESIVISRDHSKVDVEFIKPKITARNTPILFLIGTSCGLAILKLKYRRNI